MGRPTRIRRGRAPERAAPLIRPPARARDVTCPRGPGAAARGRVPRAGPLAAAAAGGGVGGRMTPPPRRRRKAEDTARAVNAALDRLARCAGDACKQGKKAGGGEASEAARDLRKVSAVRGLQTNALRRRAWPHLLGLHGGVDVRRPDGAVENGEGERAVSHRDARVVECDVERSLVHFKDVSWAENGQFTLKRRRRELAWMLNSVCEEHEGDVYYYQGLHDIASVLLLVTEDAALARALLVRLCLHHLRDCTRPALEDALDVLQLVPVLLQRHDPELAKVLAAADVPPHFALPWLLTWFSHGCTTLDEAARLFDLLLGGHPLMPLYVGVVAMSQPECRSLLVGALEKARQDDPEYWQSQAMANMHKILTSLRIPGAVGADALALEAFKLYRRHPPHTLPGYNRCIGPLASSRRWPFEGRWVDSTTHRERLRYDALRRRRELRGDWSGRGVNWSALAAVARKRAVLLTGAAAAFGALRWYIPVQTSAPKKSSPAWFSAGWALAGVVVAVGTAQLIQSGNFPLH